MRRIQLRRSTMRCQRAQVIADRAADQPLLIGHLRRSGPPAEPERPDRPHRRHQSQSWLNARQPHVSPRLRLKSRIGQQPKQGRHQQGVGRNMQVKINRRMRHIRTRRRHRAQPQRQTVAEKIPRTLKTNIAIPGQKTQPMTQMRRQQQQPKPQAHRPVIAQQLRIIIVSNVRVYRLRSIPIFWFGRELARKQFKRAGPRSPPRRRLPLLNRHLSVRQPELAVTQQPARPSVGLLQKIITQENQKCPEYRK